jgi:hypothetical protein
VFKMGREFDPAYKIEVCKQIESGNATPDLPETGARWWLLVRMPVPLTMIMITTTA